MATSNDIDPQVYAKAWRRFEGLTETRRWLLLVFLVGWMHAGAYALLVPPWQAPDEPGHYEAACLLSQARRPLTGDDLSLPLQREILTNLAQNRFWTQVRAPWPVPLPLSFAADPFLVRSGRQAGDEPPLYYLVPALICRSGLPIETRLRLIRLFGALLFGLTGMAAAWGVRGEGRQVDKETRRQGQRGGRQEATGLPVPFVSLSPCLPVYYLPLLLILLPMPTFIAGSVNDDALAMLTATAVFAAVLRAQRLGWTWRRGAGLALLLALALASKKINIFLLPWLAILGLVAGWQWLRRGAWQRRSLAKIVVSAIAVIVVLLLPSNTPARWRTTGLPWAARRLNTTAPAPPGVPDSSVIVVIDQFRRGVVQAITGPPARALRGQIVRASAWVRSPDDLPAAGRLIVRDATGFSQVDFVAGSDWQSVAISRTVALTSTRIRVALAVGPVDTERETGKLWIGRIGLIPGAEANTTANLLHNANFSRSARLGELLVLAPLEDRWQRFAPRMQAGDEPIGAMLTRYGLYWLLTFAGFWGNFGWLQRPLPVWVYALLAGICLLATTGLIRLLQRPWREIPYVPRIAVTSWLLAVVLILGQTFLPMLGRPWQPQGRYLFPALLPIAGLLMVGLDAWVNFDRHPHRWILLLVSLVVFDVICLLRASTGL